MKIGNWKLKIAKHKAFTLIEMLVVVFVLGIGLIGALSFFNINLNNQFEAKNELIAAGLAQEGADLVRNIVDYSYLNDSSNWYGELIKSDGTIKYCSKIDRDAVVDPTDKHKCKTRAKTKDKLICFDSGLGVYYNCQNSNSAGKTIFEREIAISGYDADGGGINLDMGKDCLNVIATVTWNGRVTKSTDIICKPRQ